MKIRKSFINVLSAILVLICTQVISYASVGGQYLNSSMYDQVEVRLYNIDDFSSLYINGVKFASAKYNTDTGKIEVDKYLIDGVNTLKFITQNNGGVKPDNPMSYGYQSWVNGKMILDIKCGQVGTGGCDDNSNFPGGVVHEKVLKISIKRPNKKNHLVNINSVVKGGIYLNDEFTGKFTPSILVVPTGNYRIGLGAANNRYQELMTRISNDRRIEFGNNNWLQGKQWKVLLLAIRKAHLGNGKGGNQIAQLTNGDIQDAYNDLVEVNTRWVRLFSYGLVNWNVSKLVIEDVQAVITDQGDHINQDLFLKNAGLESLRNKYDALVLFWPRIPATTDPWGQAGAVGGGSSMSVPNTWVRWVRKFPREIWLHEWLHIVEGVNGDHGFFVKVQGG